MTDKCLNMVEDEQYNVMASTVYHHWNMKVTDEISEEALCIDTTMVERTASSLQAEALGQTLMVDLNNGCHSWMYDKKAFDLGTHGAPYGNG